MAAGVEQLMVGLNFATGPFNLGIVFVTVPGHPSAIAVNETIIALPNSETRPDFSRNYFYIEFELKLRFPTQKSLFYSTPLPFFTYTFKRIDYR